MNKLPILWYFADPMCSWCWGFSPVLEQIRNHYSGRLQIALMLGGLRPGSTEPMSRTLRDEILHHWHEVQRMTGQSFTFEGAMPEGFVYDTEPASRAVITVAALNAANTLPYFHRVQSAFYVEQVDVTRAEALAKLASQYDIDTDRFLAFFDSDEARQRTQQHFQGARQAGVRGFPTLVLQQGASHEVISRGYRSYEDLVPVIEGVLAT